jgi:hypothetical protein
MNYRGANACRAFGARAKVKIKLQMVAHQIANASTLAPAIGANGIVQSSICAVPGGGLAAPTHWGAESYE